MDKPREIDRPIVWPFVPATATTEKKTLLSRMKFLIHPSHPHKLLRLEAEHGSKCCHYAFPKRTKVNRLRDAQGPVFVAKPPDAKEECA
jgi:hypothetical protein